MKHRLIFVGADGAGSDELVKLLDADARIVRADVVGDTIVYVVQVYEVPSRGTGGVH